ncbi:MAG TPA: lipopolysaccharide heptosyltransferase II [Pyrinomonadaceae bacterium]|nr:lipopolysaccharide heptosyltransferase II [Pyrinomonadaceae bacterium]
MPAKVKKTTEKKQKIIIRGTNWVGDAVMSIPALRELRRIFPDAFLTLHTRTWAKGIFCDVDFLDEILTFDKTDSKISDTFAQTKLLKKNDFDLAVLFPNSFESALVAKLAKIPKRFGYAKEGRSFLLTNSIEIPEWKNERHEVFYYLNLVSEIEKSYIGKTLISENLPNIDLQVSEERRAEARKILEENGVDLSKKTIALGVGSTNSRAKRWQAESFAKLNNLLQNDLGANVLLVGAKDEIDVSNEVFENSQQKPIILTGKTSLSQIVAILAEIDLLVSNDMGLAHIAPAVGTKTLVIFGPTNEKTTRPIGSEIIRKTVDCAPCMLRDCPIDHRCMTQISAEEVFAKAKNLIKP